MRRRRALIDRYLSDHDPVPGGEALRARPVAETTSAGERPADSSPAAGPRRRRLASLVGAAAGLAVGAVVAVSLWPTRAPTPSPLWSPQAAVAAVVASLDDDGILEWTDRQGYTPEKAARQGRSDGWAEISRWIDLSNGDSSTANHFVSFRRQGVRHDSTAYTWNRGGSSWLDEGEIRASTGQRIVRRSIADHPPSDDGARNTPVAQLRRSLRRAAEGKAAVRDAGRIDGIPVVVITERQGEDFTSRLWITKERSPRLLRGSYTMPCIMKADCSRISDDGSRDGPTTSVTETLRWTIHPRTAQWLAKVHPPAFDPANYSVVTSHRR